MTVKDVIEMVSKREEYAEDCFVRFTNKRKILHTDYIEELDKDEVSMSDEVETWDLMDIEEMNYTLFANSCIRAEDIYNEGDKVLVIIVKEKEED